MPTTVGRRALPVPIEADGPDVPRDITNLATAIQNLAVYNRGTLAAMPGTGNFVGDFYRAYDDLQDGADGTLYEWTGSAWAKTTQHGNSSFTGSLTLLGGSAAIKFDRQDSPGAVWSWYASGGASDSARLNRQAVGDLFTISNTGDGWCSGHMWSNGTIAGSAALAASVTIGAVGPGLSSGIAFQAGEAGSTIYRSAAGTLLATGAFSATGMLTGSLTQAQQAGAGTIRLVPSAGQNWIESGDGAWASIQDLAIGGQSAQLLGTLTLAAHTTVMQGNNGIVHFDQTVANMNSLRSGNNAWTGNQDFQITGYAGGTLTNIYLSATYVHCTGRVVGTAGASSGVTLQENNGHGLTFAYPISSSVQMYIDGTAVNAVSDARLKKDINDASEREPLSLVNKLRLVTFRWNHPVFEGDDTTRYGLIAQEVQDVIPEAVIVTEDEEGHLGLDERQLLAVALGAIKELSAKVEKLEAQLANS